VAAHISYSTNGSQAVVSDSLCIANSADLRTSRKAYQRKAATSEYTQGSGPQSE